MITFAVATATPHRGWGGPLAILIAFAAIGILHVIKVRNDNLRNPSPAEPRALPSGAKTQVSKVPDTDDTTPDAGWWGTIVDLGNGDRVRRVKAVWGTGSSRLPEDDGPAGEGQLVDDDLDLELDEPAAPATLDEWVAANIDQLPYAEMVRQGTTLWQVSERTVKRRIAAARAQS